jgi:prepilin peptidase CpaA
MTVFVCLSLAPPLVAACLWDVRHRLIPDWTVLWVGGVGVAAALQDFRAADAVGAVAAGAICLLLGVLAVRGGLWGLGDAKLFGACGLVAGVDGLFLLLLGTSLSGGLLALCLVALRGPVRRGLISLPAGAPRWLKAEQTRLRRHPTVPYALAITTGLATALLKA